MHVADIILLGFYLYAGLGVGFALGFVSYGMGVVDPAARNATWGARVLIFPGAAALWPLLWAKWLRAIYRRGRRR